MSAFLGPTSVLVLKMFGLEGQKALSRKQSLIKFKQQNADLLSYSVEDLRERIPAIALINPFATRLVKHTFPNMKKLFSYNLTKNNLIIRFFRLSYVKMEQGKSVSKSKLLTKAYLLP